MNILYISYNGILEPLGESQVLSYIKLLSKNHSCKIYLVTFEKKSFLSESKVVKIQNDLNKLNINWQYFPYDYKNRIIRSLKDILRILKFFNKYKQEIDIIHCRSYIPAIAGYIINKIYGHKYIFDMRGFWIDEMILNRTLNNKILIKILKYIEDRLIINASYIISLSERAISYLQSNIKYKFQKYAYVPTCVDTEKFKFVDLQYNNDQIILGCVGTIRSGWFLTDLLFDFYKMFLKKFPNSTLKIITNDNNKFVSNLLKKNGINNFKLLNCNSDNIVKQIQKLDLNIMFFSDHFAKIASCPTRLPESLSCGVPVVTNKGLGDLENIMKSNNVGILIEKNNEEEIAKAVNQVLLYIKNKAIKNNCRNLALKTFDINVGVNSIYKIYSELIIK